jgi:hypothetical protein
MAAPAVGAQSWVARHIRISHLRTLRIMPQPHTRPAMQGGCVRASVANSRRAPASVNLNARFRLMNSPAAVSRKPWTRDTCASIYHGRAGSAKEFISQRYRNFVGAMGEGTRRHYAFCYNVNLIRIRCRSVIRYKNRAIGEDDPTRRRELFHGTHHHAG